MIIKTIFNSKSSNNINKDDNKPASRKFIKAVFLKPNWTVLKLQILFLQILILHKNIALTLLN